MLRKSLPFLLCLVPACQTAPKAGAPPVEQPRVPSTPQRAEEMPELQTEVLMIQYASAQELAHALRMLFQPAMQPAGQLRQPAAIVPDERTNSLIVRATPADLGAIKRLVSVLDRRVEERPRAASAPTGN